MPTDLSGQSVLTPEIRLLLRPTEERANSPDVGETFLSKQLFVTPAFLPHIRKDRERTHTDIAVIEVFINTSVRIKTSVWIETSPVFFVYYVCIVFLESERL